MTGKAKRKQDNNLSSETDKQLNNIIISEIKKFTKQQKVEEFDRLYKVLRKTFWAIQPLIWVLYHKDSTATREEKAQVKKYKNQLDTLQDILAHLLEFEPQKGELETGTLLFLWPGLYELAEVWLQREKRYLEKKESALIKKPWKRTKWSSKDPAWDHDHCEICFRSISDKDELKMAYNYRSYWLCPRCFRRLKTNSST